MSADITAGPATGAASSAFPRHEQTFPTLTHPEIERMRRFGELRAYKDGETLFETGKGGPVLIGPSSLGDTARLQNFLARNGQPHHVLDPATDKDAADLVARYSASRADLPLVVCPDGSVLRNPSETELALAVGMITNRAHEKLYDVAVVGGGPAGLATAVYAASEGLSVAVFDARAFGGQAGALPSVHTHLGYLIS